MHQIIPGILEKDFSEIEKKLEVIKPFSNIVHIDFIDGKFAPNVTFLDPAPFKKYSEFFYLEAHLMVEDPLQYIYPLAQAGFRRFIGHIEKMQNVEEFVAEGQLLGEVGFGLDVQTPIDSIKVPFDDLDIILLMAVKAGNSGQEFIPNVLGKIASLREKTGIPIEVDGGVTDRTILDIKNAGAQRVVTTSFIFNQQDSGAGYQRLLDLIK